MSDEYAKYITKKEAIATIFSAILLIKPSVGANTQVETIKKAWFLADEWDKERQKREKK